MRYPIFQEVLYQSPFNILRLFSKEKNVVLLESTQRMPHCGRYSFIMCDPFFTMISKNNKNIFEELENALKEFPLTFHRDLPPFQGGIAGFFSYDLNQYLEKIKSSQQDDMEFPDCAVGFYDVVIAFDHELKRGWIFSSGYPLQDHETWKSLAKERLEWMVKKIKNCHLEQSEASPAIQDNLLIYSNFSKDTYQAAVEKVKEYILAGDVYEANISQRFHAILPENFQPILLYKKLGAINPAPFAAYLSFADTTIVSASPERFLKLTDHFIETRPIKGTRKRGVTALEDETLAQELLYAEKDRAENIMIVDLLRNDLSIVCENHSVKVPKLCGLESYATVHHLVSVVTGKLQKRFNAIDLLRATFPGGSITGAPKIRAMEIIAEIEPTKRGPYCGSIGYIGFNGDMDLSITIRTFAIKNNHITFQAGGAIVMDSDSLVEYEETLTKASALLRALNSG